MTRFFTFCRLAFAAAALLLSATAHAQELALADNSARPHRAGVAAGSLPVEAVATALCTPAVGEPGTLVVLNGPALGTARAVYFNGVAATSFSVRSKTRLVAIVPANATSGQLVVRTAVGAVVTRFEIATGELEE